jgi:hypothetical protein
MAGIGLLTGENCRELASLRGFTVGLEAKCLSVGSLGHKMCSCVILLELHGLGCFVCDRSFASILCTSHFTPELVLLLPLT